MLRVIGIKTFLDGGMLTGSAYMLEPWGVSKTYSITDPQYRGVLLIPRERLLAAGPSRGRERPAVHRPFRRRRRRSDAARHLRAARQGTAARRAAQRRGPASPTAISSTPTTSRGLRSSASLADVQPIWLYLGRPHARRPIRQRPPGPLPAAKRPVRRRSHHRRRIRSHAEDRRPPGDQPLRPALGHVDRHDAPRPAGTTSAPSRNTP